MRHGTTCLVLCLAIVCGGLVANWQNFPAVASREVEWIGENRAPFLVAFSIFGTQALFVSILLYTINNITELADCWGKKFHSVISLYAWVSVLAAVLYFCKYYSSGHSTVTVPGVGDYLLTQHLLWVISTPSQWFVFKHICTKATDDEMVPIYVHTVMVQVFGMAMYFVGNTPMRWFCFLASSWCFAVSFTLGFRLKLSKDMDVVGTQMRRLMLGVGLAFPTVVLFRWCGLMDPWTEQVLAFTCLDVLSKSVTFSAILASRLIAAWARINGTVQLVVSSQDMMFEVDENWQLMNVLNEAASKSAIAARFGEIAHFTSLCINDEHRARLVQAGCRADSQHMGALTPKCAVVFRLPGDSGELLAECRVSKCNHGRRILGIVVSGQVDNLISPCSCQADDQDDVFDERTPSESSATSGTSTTAGPPKRELNLTSCNEVLRFNDSARQMVNALFVQPHTCCALVTSEESVAPTVILASSLLQELFFRGGAMPKPLADLVGGGLAERILVASRADGPVVHQWRGIRTPTGILTEVTVLPFRGMSSADCSARHVQLSILIMALADHHRLASDPTEYISWSLAGHQLVCDEGTRDKAMRNSPPRSLMPLIFHFMGGCLN